MLKLNWWKYLAILMLAYVLGMGLLVPLGSGIKSVNPMSARKGERAIINVKGYNTHYTQDGDKLSAQLRVTQDKSICALNINVINDTELAILFDIPAVTPLDTVTSGENKSNMFPLLEIYGPVSGKSTLEGAVVLRQLDPKSRSAAQLCTYKTEQGQAKLSFPFINQLEETARNLFFHVPMWFGMMLVLLASMVYSVKYLRKTSTENDIKAEGLAIAGVVFGLLGVATGAVWANFTWGSPWSFDVKQNMSAVALLIYLAYFVLRASFDDPAQRAKVSAVYNVFAFATLIPLLYIIPRMADSLHPGMGGNPAFSSYDLDNTMRMVFYPAVIAWTLLGFWLADIYIRTARLKHKLDEI
jgi:heme exporter protein C